MDKIKNLYILASLILFYITPCCSEEQWPDKMLRDMDCLRQHGLVQGTVAEVLRGDAHFAPYYRESKIGIRVPSIRYNGQFVEGKTNLSPDIVKICIPNAILQKID
jgi:hypothetical protein